MRDVAVLSGYFVRCPLGGYAWQILHYLWGLRACGFDAYFYEDTAYHPDCFDPFRGQMPAPPGAGLRVAGEFLRQFEFGDRWMFFDAERGRHFGRGAEESADILASARLLISLAAVNRLPRSVGRTRVFIDIDPGFTQAKAAEDANLRDYLAEHDVHFTIGERIGRLDCPVPRGGIDWRATRQPIATEIWEPLAGDGDAYTTVGRWDEQRRDVTIGGRSYSWSKRREWMRVLDLPARTGCRFRLAMDVDRSASDADLLRRHGWEIVDPIAVSRDPFAYREFLRGSRGEFTVSKAVTVQLRTGWFSDRGACYLAAGRPVVVQDTAFGEFLPTGRGLLCFTDVASAQSAIAAVESDLAAHRAAARDIARNYFEAGAVMADLLRRI